jgi:hypothetical protein
MVAAVRFDKGYGELMAQFATHGAFLPARHPVWAGSIVPEHPVGRQLDFERVQLGAGVAKRIAAVKRRRQQYLSEAEVASGAPDPMVRPASEDGHPVTTAICSPLSSQDAVARIQTRRGPFDQEQPFLRRLLA